MNGLALIMTLGALLSASPAISGRVVDASGNPVAGARVFLEAGLGGTIVETRSDASGAYAFDDSPVGVVGLVAHAEGYAFGGRTVTVAVAEARANTDIVLRRPVALGGKVVDPKGDPIAGARITRVVLLGTEKVGLPLAKLKALGYAEPVSGVDGRFSVPLLPEGEKVALKVGHPQFAQASPTDLAAGDERVRIRMYPGVYVKGQALSRSEQRPVANAQIIITRATEPYDSVVARTDANGNYAVRLEPSAYVAQAATTEYRSPSLEKFTVTGEAPQMKLNLLVAGSAELRGKVADAASGGPIAGAKLVLEANGGVAARVRTGPTGEFRFEAAEGDNVVILESAPGYLPPERSAVRVTLAQGQSVEVPTFWVAPIPAYGIQVVDGDMKPVPGAVVSLLRPAQFGWRVTDADGRTPLQFASLPPDGIIVGMAEHPTQPLGALFSLNQAQARDAKVQLLPLGTVTGTTTAGNKKLEGVVVGATFAQQPFSDSVVAWQTLTRDGGMFSWDAVVPLVSLKCAAKAGEKTGESAPFTLEPSGSVNIGRIAVSQGTAGKSQHGRSLEWHEGRLLAGPAPSNNAPAVVLYCTAAEAPAVVEGLATARKVLAGKNIVFAAVVSGGYSGDAEVPVLEGTRPGTATTYVTDADGKVVLETFGLPPLRTLQRIAP